ncbi:hypothetical protein ACFYT3_35100 [Nocardia amikacinitolerans]|uniref:hypothetical protein n=1 Tax=Nocardia amikacinitolerans TaxID=756689 RepID=UPI00367C454C
MAADLARYLAAVRADPHYAPYLPDHALPNGPILIVGQHAAFATHPRPATPIAVFPGGASTTAVIGYPVMALVRVEHATAVITVGHDGTSTTRWEHAPFPGLPTGISWHLHPAELDAATGRWMIGAGRWAAGGRQAVLPRSVTAQVPGAPRVVALHDHDPHTGRRWSS